MKFRRNLKRSLFIFEFWIFEFSNCSFFFIFFIFFDFLLRVMSRVFHFLFFSCVGSEKQKKHRTPGSVMLSHIHRHYIYILCAEHSMYSITELLCALNCVEDNNNWLMLTINYFFINRNWCRWQRRKIKCAITN